MQLILQQLKSQFFHENKVITVISDIRQDITEEKLSAIQNVYHLSEGWKEMAAAPGQI
jgi:uncharacterized protein YnzC (UPF0291/DUF896 family)